VSPPHWGYDRDFERLLPKSGAMLAQHQHVQDGNGPSNLGDIQDYPLVGTILILFLYSIEKVV
jgi:hypothetical protein